MGFSFGFTEEELNNKEPHEEQHVKLAKSNPLDETNVQCEPKVTYLKDLLEGLIGNRITFERLELGTTQNEHIYKRELFDVKQQLMMEDDFKSRTNDDLFKILIGDTYEDLKHGVYEGGLKSWECSYDLIRKLDTMDLEKQGLTLDSSFNCIELGCGTSLPSLYIFDKIVRYRRQKELQCQPVRFILSDYNIEVLRLVSLPNILVNWCMDVLTLDELREIQGDKQRSSTEKNDIYVSRELAQKFTSWLASSKIDLCFVSGSWCRKFVDIIHGLLPQMPDQKNLILTSETIYSPPILPIVGEMLLELTYNEMPLTILTAKDIYFGVGGSVNQFLQFLEERNQAQPGKSRFYWNIEKVDSHLKRSVITIGRRWCP